MDHVQTGVSGFPALSASLRTSALEILGGKPGKRLADIRVVMFRGRVRTRSMVLRALRSPASTVTAVVGSRRERSLWPPLPEGGGAVPG